MPHYIVLMNWTDKGVAEVKDSPKKAEAAHKALEQAGGKMELYYTMGPYDLVAVAEAPDDATLMRTVLAIASKGTIRTQTLKAFTMSEAAEIIDKLGQCWMPQAKAPSRPRP